VVELMSYGLTGLTAMLVIAFCFAYGDELPRTREKSSYDPINHAPRNDSSHDRDWGAQPAVAEGS
jgi:hypothetical protein